MRYLRVILCLAILLAIPGCGYDAMGKKIEPERVKTNESLETAKMPAAEIKSEPLTVAKDTWYGSQSIRLRRGYPLPETQEGARSVALVSAIPLSLQAISNQISTQTGLPVRLIEGADKPVRPAQVQSIQATTSATGQRQLPSAIGGPGVALPTPGLPVAYEGSLSGLLDLIAGNFGINWFYDGTAVVFTRYETRTFVIESLPGEQDLQDGLKADEEGTSSSGGGGYGGGGSQQAARVKITQTADLTVKIKFWEEFTKVIDTLLSGDGAFTIAPSSGIVTVMASPERMAKIAEFISGENKRLSRQIAINVEVFTVTMNDLDEYGLDLTLLFQQSSRWPTFGWAGTPSAIVPATASALSATVLNAPAGSTLSKFNKSSAIFRALSKVGDVARVAQVPMTTLNNRPATRQIVVNKAYLAQITSTTTDNGVTTTSATPGNVQTGISLQLVPRILDDGRIMLQYSLSMRDLLDMVKYTFDSEKNSVQLPETQARVFMQQSLLNNGSTLVLAGFEERNLERERRGVGDPTNWILGGGQTTSESRQVMVIAITATEIDVTHPKEG